MATGGALLTAERVGTFLMSRPRPDFDLTLFLLLPPAAGAPLLSPESNRRLPTTTLLLNRFPCSSEGGGGGGDGRPFDPTGASEVEPNRDSSIGC